MSNNMYPVSSSGGQSYKRLYTGAQGDNPFFPAEQTPTADTESIDVADLNQALILADGNQDGIVSRQELASAAHQIMSAPHISLTENKIAGVFSTMVLGGKDGQGLFPDMNGDGGITANEVSLLAHGDGLNDSITKNDFSYAFGERFNPDGTAFQLSDLEAIAAGQDPTGTQDTAPQEQSQAQQVLTKVISSFSELLQALINPPQSEQSGSGLTSAFVNFFTAITAALTQPGAQSA